MDPPQGVDRWHDSHFPHLSPPSRSYNADPTTPGASYDWSLRVFHRRHDVGFWKFHLIAFLLHAVSDNVFAGCGFCGMCIFLRLRDAGEALR